MRRSVRKCVYIITPAVVQTVHQGWYKQYTRGGTNSTPGVVQTLHQEWYKQYAYYGICLPPFLDMAQNMMFFA